MATADLVIVSDQIVQPGRVGPGAIAIREGRILAVTDGPFAGPAREVLDATGFIVLPGLIAPHVHMRDPGLTEAEDWLTGTRAAAAGGVTTVLDHPNTIPPQRTSPGTSARVAQAFAGRVCPSRR